MKKMSMEIYYEKSLNSSISIIESISVLKEKLKSEFDSKYSFVLINEKVFISETTWGLSIQDITSKEFDAVFDEIMKYFTETKISNSFVRLAFHEPTKSNLSKVLLSKTIIIKNLE